MIDWLEPISDQPIEADEGTGQMPEPIIPMDIPLAG